MYTCEAATRSAHLREKLDRHRAWIEEMLGASLNETVVLHVDLPLAQIAVPMLLGFHNRHNAYSHMIGLLRPLVESLSIPPDASPFVEVASQWCAGEDGQEETFLGHWRAKKPKYNMGWVDVPVAIKVRAMKRPFVAFNLSFHVGLDSNCETVQSIVVAHRTETSHVIELMDTLRLTDRHPQLMTFGGESQPITPLSWDDLILDESVTSLLRKDFETFYEREEWFRRNRLPFRRGYLLHGPPGNGKTSVIRAMATSRGMNAHTVRLFDPNLDDGVLDRMFTRAAKQSPSLILFEDLDRAFPRVGEPRCKASLQQLLNSLDGVGTQDGVVVVATANEPTALDAAILRRPGRFDRAVCFANPRLELRFRYFLKMNKSFTRDKLTRACMLSDGFSFAQLREAYILAGQRSFERNAEMTAGDLLEGVETLRSATQKTTKRHDDAGFLNGFLADATT